MASQILLAGKYKDKVEVNANFVNGEKCVTTDGETSATFAHVFGHDNTVTGKYGHSDGSNCKVYAESAHAIGTGITIANGSNNAIFIGNNITSSSSAQNSIAVGNDIDNDSKGTVVIGSGVTVGDNFSVNSVIVAAAASTNKFDTKDLSATQRSGGTLTLYAKPGDDDDKYKNLSNIYINNKSLREYFTENVVSIDGIYEDFLARGFKFVKPFITEDESKAKYPGLSIVDIENSSICPYVDLYKAKSVTLPEFLEDNILDGTNDNHAASIGFVKAYHNSPEINNKFLCITKINSSDNDTILRIASIKKTNTTAKLIIIGEYINIPFSTLIQHEGNNTNYTPKSVLRILDSAYNKPNRLVDGYNNLSFIKYASDSKDDTLDIYLKLSKDTNIGCIVIYEKSGKDNINIIDTWEDNPPNLTLEDINAETVNIITADISKTPTVDLTKYVVKVPDAETTKGKDGYDMYNAVNVGMINKLYESYVPIKGNCEIFDEKKFIGSLLSPDVDIGLQSENSQKVINVKSFRKFWDEKKRSFVSNYAKDKTQFIDLKTSENNPLPVLVPDVTDFNTGFQSVNVNSLKNYLKNSVGDFVSVKDINQSIAGTKTFTGTLQATNTIQGTALKALWADLAEFYESDKEYEPGTLVSFSTNNGKITIADKNHEAHAVVSTKPGLMIGAVTKGLTLPVALVGRVPVKVIGECNAGKKLVLSDISGVAVVANENDNRNIIGIALESSSDKDIKLIETVVRMNF